MLRRSLLAAPALQAKRPPNILYLMTDQQHAGMLSCAGNPWLKTPHLDRLAAAGTRFELAYSANPVCMPARTSMMTGRYPSHFQMRANGPAKVPAEALPLTLGNLFRKAGYETAFGGKTHWPAPMTPQSIGFEYITPNERDGLATASADWLRQKRDRPFLLVSSFINPHDICYMAIDAHAKATNLSPAPLPKSVVERQRVAEASQVPAGAERPPLPANHAATVEEPAALGRFGGFRGWVRQNWTADDWRLHRWAYARLTERVDAEIGRVLDALHETGHDRDTVVIFASDHGDMDSAHGFEHKSLPYEESARVPFFISGPGLPRGRVDRRHLIGSCTDLLPTLCDFAGITAPAGLPGRSLRPLVSRAAAPRWREDLAIECTNSRSLRTKRYKYSVFDGPEPLAERELLVDLERDPGEMTNLARRPTAAGVLADHRRRWRARVEELNDNWGRGLA